MNLSDYFSQICKNVAAALRKEGAATVWSHLSVGQKGLFCMATAKFDQRRGFANAAETPAEALVNEFISPAFNVVNGGDLFFPYGEFKHKKGMQRFSRAGAEAMANAFSNPPGWVRKIWNWFTNEPLGVPIYIGHPDVPELAARYPDKSAYGWVNALEPQASGMLVKIKWSDDGRKLIENARYRYTSPYWFGDPDKTGIFNINFLRSIGLTNTPNIAMPAIANTEDDIPAQDMVNCALCNEPFNYAAQKETSAGAVNCPHCGKSVNQKGEALANNQTTNAMLKKLITLLGLANEADEAAVEAAVTALHAKCGTLTTENATLTTAKAGLENELTTARTGLANAQADARAAREARVNAALDRLVTETRVLPAERDAQFTRLTGLANDAEITTEIGKLAAVDPKLKQQAKSSDAAGGKSAMLGGNSERSMALANAIEQELTEVKKTITDPAKAYDIAWNRVRNKKPELFANA